MISESESINAYEFKKYYVILPSKEYLKWDIQKYLKKKQRDFGKKCKEGFNYNSLNNKSFLSIDELKNLILKK